MPVASNPHDPDGVEPTAEATVAADRAAHVAAKARSVEHRIQSNSLLW
jgi:hypothetical protein